MKAHVRRFGVALALTVALLGSSAAGATASTGGGGDHSRGHGHGDGHPGHHTKHQVNVQLLSFNDFHGHLEATDDPLDPVTDPSQTPVGGVEYLSSTLTKLRGNVGKHDSLTVAAGDLIGGSTFLSGLFHDEPSVEALETLGLDVSSVGNHEFDEGTDELLRMQYGGCRTDDGCYFSQDPYDGADFPWLAANVIRKDNGRSLLPGTAVRKVHGVKVGFIGMTLKATPTLVNPAGVSSVTFTDEVKTANAAAQRLQRRGVQAIVVLIHEGGVQEGTYGECNGISGPIVDIASRLDPAIDAVVSGHTHRAYVCDIPDPNDQPRMVTSAASYGQVVTETILPIDRRTKDVVRAKVTSTNHLVTRDEADPAETEILEKWNAIAAPLAARVVGSVAEDITGDASGDRGIETPMADLLADAMLWGTADASAGGAQVAFMNVGGVRGSFLTAPKYQEQPGEITYAEAYDVAPFGNLLETMDLTGAQIKAVLEQQYDPSRDRQNLALGVSEGFTYTWDASRPQGDKVVAGSMALNGEPMDLDATYRVATLNFLAEGGDSFTGFTEGTNVLGGAEDLANLVDFLEANPGLTAPADRVSGL